MNSTKEIMSELKAKGNDAIKKLWLKHGIKEPFFGVKVEDLKVIQKRVKKNYLLSLELYATGNSDAMYLAGLIADEKLMTKDDLMDWAQHAESTNIVRYTVPWITAESKYAHELATAWINNKNMRIAAIGWSTLSSYVAITKDEDLDLGSIKLLLKKVAKEIHQAENEVRSAMNIFMISVGCYVAPLSKEVIEQASKIGAVSIDVGETACKIPFAVDYIRKVQAKNQIGKKKKMARC